MSWQDRLVNATFRGVTFLTESHETRLGRRLVVHEFPGADLPLIEDFGAKAAEVHLTAYFIGPDYDLARDEFLLLLQKPGADQLVHPWLGSMEVRAKEWSLGESNEKNGFCTIGIDFVPAGAVIAQAQIDAVDNAAAKFESTATMAQQLLALAVMGSDAINGFIAEVSGQLDGLRTILAVATLPLTWSQQVAHLIQGIKSDFLTLLDVPDAYSAAVRGVFSVIGGADIELDAPIYIAPLANNAVTILPDDYRVHVIGQLCRLAVSRPINGRLLIAKPSLTSPLEPKSNLAKNDALTAIFIIAACGNLALADYADAQTRDRVLGQLLNAIDFILPALPDAIFQELAAARVALIDALMAQDLAYSRQFTIIEPMPATVLAHRLDNDEALFNAANGVRHPLFVSGGIHG